MPQRPRLLVFAYACEPGRGSEPGAGWGVVMALRSFADCVVLVGTEHVEAIRRWAETDTGPSVDFVTPVDDSSRSGGRFVYFYRYLRWLRHARRAAGQLAATERFDGVVHATYSTYWLPTPAVDLGIPSVWGPVGGGVTSPPRLWSFLGPRGVAVELLDLVAVRLLSLRPATRRTWRRATLRILQNEETRARLPAGPAGGDPILNHASFHAADLESSPGAAPSGAFLLWAGPLESRKGPELAIRAFAASKAPRLVVAGDGPERKRMERLARDLGVDDRVTFEGWVGRDRVLALMHGSAAVVFTGLREEGGLALAEALLMGCPSIVLDHGGAGYIARQAAFGHPVTLVEPGSRQETIGGFAAAMTDHARTPRPHGDSFLDRKGTVERLESLVRTALGEPT